MTFWHPIPSCPNYLASSDGEIRRIGSARPLRPTREKSGHLRVSLWHDGIGRSEWVHRLVCEAFHGPAPFSKAHAAHANGVPSDNRPGNLSWKTATENAADKKLHGTENIGARNGGAVLGDEQIKEIRRKAAALPRSSGGKRIKKGALAPMVAEYGVTAGCLRQIIYGQRWRHVP